MNEQLELLRNQLQSGEMKYEEWLKFYNDLKNSKEELQNLLEYATEKDKNFKILYEKLVSENASDLVDNLRSKGFVYRHKLGDAFQNMGYRILEQARAGKKDDVYYSILRIFVANKENFPGDLVEAFKPIYSDEMFKVFIFSFLSGIIGKEQQTENKN